MSKEIVRITRILIYEGEREVIEKIVENSIQGTKVVKPSKHKPYKITAITLDQFPQIIKAHESIDLEVDESDLQSLLNPNS